MNRVLFLILLGGATFLIVLYVSRPDLIKDFWLWGVGLAGPLVKAAHSFILKMKESFFPSPSKETQYMQNKTLNTNEQG